MRKSLTTMLEEGKQIQVIGVARNGEEAVQQVQQLKPDVVTMDVEMPGMTGLQALQHIMAKNPVPVIMVSSITVEGAQETLQAWNGERWISSPNNWMASHQRSLRFKSNWSPKCWLPDMPDQSLRTIPMSGRPKSARLPSKTLSSFSVSVTRGTKFIAIGCSTGGPQALFEIMPTIPGGLSGRHRDRPTHAEIVYQAVCRTPEQSLCPGCARGRRWRRNQTRSHTRRPGGMQFRVVKKNHHQLGGQTVSQRRKPSPCPLGRHHVESVAALYGERSIGVILTGMGHDGLEGMKAIKAAKGRTVAQDEASSVVYGMPKAVVEAGCADKVVSLSKVVGEIMNMV